MTAVEDVPNATLGGVTINTEMVEKIISKKLITVTAPQSSGNWAAGKKATKIIDLLRIETRFTIRGTITNTDAPTLESANEAGGVMSLVWDGTTYQVNTEKLGITKHAKNEASLRDVMITCIEGVNM